MPMRHKVKAWTVDTGIERDPLWLTYVEAIDNQHAYILFRTRKQAVEFAKKTKKRISDISPVVIEW